MTIKCKVNPQTDPPTSEFFITPPVIPTQFVYDDITYEIRKTIWDDDHSELHADVFVIGEFNMVCPASQEAIDNAMRELLPHSKLQAVKWYKEHCGVGLKEAKDFVDEYELKYK